jgi:allophanate hydrolase subunit 2
VISADLPLLGQITPGDEVSFEAVSMDEAIKSLRQMEDQVETFKRSL